MNDFQRKYGPWALVAGASEGIGAAFSKQLADRGVNLALLARRAEPLEALRAEIGARVEVRMIPHDLADVTATAGLVDDLADLEVGLVVYNAALSLIGRFLDRSIEEHLTELDVNCRSMLTLAHGFGGRMVERGHGGLVLMASMSGFQGTPLIANYAATKAYDRVLAEGLWYELGRQGVDVLSVVAGSTSTPGYLSSKPRALGALTPPVLTPDAVAAEALAALGRQPILIPGRANRLAGFLSTRLLPRKVAIEQMAAALEKMYGPEDG